MKAENTTVDADEIAHFSRLASEWWNPRGKFKPLHVINPLRIEWILAQTGGVKDKTLLDIGCGGGLISEPMARLGAHVTAIDAAQRNIDVAKLHASEMGLAIDYRCTSAEDLVDTRATFDIVLALEIIEHVADVPVFVSACAKLINPGGTIILSTINRTPKSYALAILGAEYILRWVPRGTHDWKKFLRPSELHKALRNNNLEVTKMTGMVMNPLTFEWRFDANDLSVNYLLAGRK